ncbi:hypothetical protein Vadar_004767 [Vaccinium darrowii]|uniref:Uncharacterized protein n=1 Tax=Vaccinium darrowii TaxID=229202 RepID=A0ACB7YCV3_9ERIC|nr:hypothetical protein Vadar_004767 [Vaccinium darrowii]
MHPTGKATQQSDVYAFGVVLLEIVCGLRPGTRIDEFDFLVDWVWSLHREGRILDAVEDRLGDEYVVEEAQKVLILALACSHPIASERPKTQAIVQIISGFAPVPYVPPFKPAFVWPLTPYVEKDDISSLEINFPSVGHDPTGQCPSCPNSISNLPELNTDHRPRTTGCGPTNRESRSPGGGKERLHIHYIVCGLRPGTRIDEFHFLVDWVWSKHREGRIIDVVDERLGDEYVVEEAQKMLILALACSHPIAGERPTTEGIVQIISGLAPVSYVPPFKPAFVWPSMPSVEEDDINRLSGTTESRSFPTTHLGSGSTPKYISKELSASDKFNIV